MNLSEQIVAKQAELVAARDVLVDLNTNAADAAAIDEATATVEKLSDELDRLKRSEAAISKSVARTGEASAAAVTRTPRVKDSEKADLIVKSALVHYEAFIRHKSVDEVVSARFGGDEALGAIVKNAQNPAMTNVAGWAQELVRESYGAFMDLLQPESVIPRLPLQRFSFDGYQSIKIPARSDTPNLAGAFRAEGAPIRVGAMGFTTKTLTPKSMGVIASFTEELIERSTPNIVELARNAMIQDTARALDTAFLSNTAGSATAPAGLQTYASGANTAASAGASLANIITDIRGRLQQMMGLNLGRRPVWVMNPARFMGVKLMTNAAGALAFPEASNNQLMGIPVVTSVTVPATVVYLLDAAEIVFAGGAPRFLASNVATIHEEDTTPLPLADDKATPGGSATGVGNGPVRSLYQTNSAALRCVWELDWSVMRPGSVQTLTAVSW